MPNRLVFAAIVAAVVVLAACGGGGGGSVAQSGGPQQPGRQPPAQPPAQPPPPRAHVNDTLEEPIVSGLRSNGRLLSIGTWRVAANLLDRLDGSHDGAAVGSARVRNGIASSELLRYLRADAAAQKGRVQRWGNTPPTVRMIQGASEEYRSITKHAVRLINSVLPPNWQLKFDNRDAVPDGHLNPGIIEVNFIPRERWSRSSDHPNAVGIAYWEHIGGRITGAAALVDPTRRTTRAKRLDTLLHELFHALGRGHVNPSDFPDTIMHPSGDLAISTSLSMSRLDEAAMYAIYSRLRPGTRQRDLNANTLGPWSAVSSQSYGRLDTGPEAVVFGASWENGNIRPFAHALNPSPLPRGLSGSASWAGRLIGLTPRAETVAGAMDMSIQLATHRGSLNFTGLEKWAAHAGPGALGTGAQWGDGDLRYRIAVDQGHYVHRTGGDAGTITGAFFHDNRKVGGTLRRTDLAAGFAGKRP